MKFFQQPLKIDFLKARYWTAAISLILCIGSLVVIGVRGLNWGLDFTGGTVVELHYPHEVDLPSVRKTLNDAGFSNAVVQYYGSSQEILIRLAPSQTNATQEQVGKHIQQLMQQATPDVVLKRSDIVGAQMGREMTEQGLVALMVAILGTVIYVAMRFEYRFALGAGIALLHDPLLIVGIFALFQIEFDLPTLAAILAIVGYSINDTIVVFDRIKENFVQMRKASTIEVVIASINQTLTRTVMTSFLTLLVVVALLVYGGQTLFGFSLALTIGIVICTYSSIYIASRLAVALVLSRQDLLPAPKKEEDDRP